MKVRIKNPDLTENERSWATTSITAGATSAEVDTTSGLLANDYILVGTPATEKTELRQISTVVSASLINTDTFLYDHPTDTPIYFTDYNQYQISYNTASGGDFTTLDLTDIEWDEEYSEYTDSTTGVYSYKVRFYNSTTTTYSDYSDVVLSGGYPRNAVRAITDFALKMANDPDATILSRDEVLTALNEAQDIISALNDHWYFLLKDGTAISSVAGQDEYALSTDYDRMHSLLVRYVDSGNNTDQKYRLKYAPLNEIDYDKADQGADDDDTLSTYTIIPNGYFRVYPTPEHAYHTFYPRFYKKMTDLDSDSDATDVPMPEILENYALYKIYSAKGNDGAALAERYRKEFYTGIDILKQWQKKHGISPKRLLIWRGSKSGEQYSGEENMTDADAVRENYF